MMMIIIIMAPPSRFMFILFLFLLDYLFSLFLLFGFLRKDNENKLSSVIKERAGVCMWILVRQGSEERKQEIASGYRKPR